MGSENKLLPRIAIIGAGACGLLLAHGLQKNGFKVTVYEKETRIGERTREWTMLVHWAYATFRKMLPDEILNDFSSAHADPFLDYEKAPPIPFYDGTTGDVVFRMPGNVRRISRTRLRQLCSRGLDIRWGKQVADLQVGDTGPVSIVFKDGTTEEADFVIGADGGNSQIRKWLLGEEASKTLPSEYAIANGIVKYETAEQAAALREPNPICTVSVIPGGVTFMATQDVGDPDDLTTYSFHVARVWKTVQPYSEGPEAIAKTKASITPEMPLNEPFRSAIMWIPETASLTINQLHYWATVPWDNKRGRVTLAGDAAHCMLPNRGQGLNHALGDVDKMITEFTKIRDNGVSLQDALKHYEEEVFVRGRKAALESLEDADALMKAQSASDVQKARHNKQGWEK
ncbi:hypothetical protein QBC34DRAFT_350306 [Podospora aff. communis PSN243]|uniref:FAD-binding domain-containing protein n=1 Tax=Podospora aff. communis PSN243 TaxID=3040156 RepID=A0AAV9GN58_9PEZI|nr:hypothetical protein QBC34DRAFT_350306 [Podospora aff. communis PSN243]